jgi:prepilin-type N-terminal cleavage/methylation domain-containing protein
MISPQTNLHRLPLCRTHGRVGGFSLIELLVVISIIGLLATLTVGLIGVASRKNKESRLKTDLNKHVSAIENYKAAIGSYPPDNPGKPSTNQLFYELSGTIYGEGRFSIPSRQESIAASDVFTYFGRKGFANSARDAKEIKVTEEFKPSQFKELPISNVDVEILIVPVRGPKVSSYRGVSATGVSFPLEIKARDNSLINPWLYDSSSPNRNNPSGFDLWAEVVLGKNIVRFSNWEKEPVVIGPAP